MTSNQPKFYAEELEPRSHGGLIIALIVGAAISHGCAIWFGMWLKGEQLARQRQAEMLMKPAVQRENPRLQLGCSKRDRAEYTWVCQQRENAKRVNWMEAAR